MSESQLAYEEPEKIRVDRRGVPLRQALRRTRRTSRWSRTSTSTRRRPGDDINWLEDIELLAEDGTPAVFDRYSNSFIKIYFAIPAGRENEIARKVLITHLQSGNSYGIQLKEKHSEVPAARARAVGGGLEDGRRDWKPPCSRAGKLPLH